MVKLIVDAMGGDYSPAVNVEGSLLALENLKDVSITLVGKEDEINRLLKDKKYDTTRLSVINADDVISCNDKPTEAMRVKKESSLYKSYELLRTDDSYGGMVSIGSTGAVLAGSVMRLGRIKEVSRPALVPTLPTFQGDNIVALCDAGANAECTPQQLNQFATMGSFYLKKAYGVENPRVGLLNIGTEENKGDTLRKEAYQLLMKNEKINFVGNLEGRDFLSGDYDVVVCDGFSGNVLLKSTEGACVGMMKLIKGALYKNFKTKIGALLVKDEMYKVKGKMDYNEQGGAALLGVKKTIVKGHGGSKSKSVYKCIEQAYIMEKSGLRKDITEGLKEEA